MVSDEERRTIVTGIVEAVRVDLDGNSVEIAQPKEWFYPLRAPLPETSA